MSFAMIPREGSMFSGFEKVEICGARDFIQAQQEAWDEAERKRNQPVMMAWWDREADTCFPSPICGGEHGEALTGYARAKGSDLVVSFNDEKFVFLFRDND